MIFGLAFAHPALLAALVALPLLWLLLRAIPPAPVRRRFPAVSLLLGLTDEDRQTDRTPLWLLLLRAAAVAAAIIGLAGPILNPDPPAPEGKTGGRPLLVLMDGGWAEAGDWPQRRDRAARALAEASRQGRPTALHLLTLAPTDPVTFGPGAVAETALLSAAPQPFLAAFADWPARLPEGEFDTLWIADGLDHPGRADLARALGARGDLRVVETGMPLLALPRPALQGKGLDLRLLRPAPGLGLRAEIRAIGPDPSGVERELARIAADFATGATEARVRLDLPPELRNRVQRLEILGQSHAGAVHLADDSLKRRKIALVAGAAKDEGVQLLDPLHYLRQALAPSADLIEGALRDLLPAKPDVIILADIAQLSQSETDGLLDWLEEGGLLLRFAGPRVAASDLSRDAEDALMPVRLRQGGRDLGGAMTWGEAKTLGPFAQSSPFFGLPLPPEVTVRQQVLAQPDPDLASRTLAALSDGTPLVTRKVSGAGQIVLFHVPANAEWSSLPLSGLFMQMLERLAVTSGSGGTIGAEALAGRTWVPRQVLDGAGRLASAEGRAGVEGATLAKARDKGPDSATPPGLYADGDRSVALNAMDGLAALAPANWPPGTHLEGIAPSTARDLTGLVLGLAAALFLADILASLWVGGRLPMRSRALPVLLAAMLAIPAPPARAETDEAAAILATRGIALAYVKTGDPALDAQSEAGLLGLSDQLWARTAVEPEAPIGVDVEVDDLAFFPFLYWPVTPAQTPPSAEGYDRLNRFLRTGGMILFDTRDGDVAGLGGAITPEGAHLQLLAAGLDIPPLEPLPQDHVLTRTFYLIGDLAGRQSGAPVWVEAAPDLPEDPAMAEAAAPQGFRNANDGVTPVIIGGNDWAAAWAINPDGSPMFPVGRGLAGEDQREMAIRAGINIVMHVLTGNYKSDQVHVPALLERLGQ